MLLRKPVQTGGTQLTGPFSLVRFVEGILRKARVSRLLREQRSSAVQTVWRREVNSNFMYCSEIDGKLLALRRVATGATWLFKRQQPVGFTGVEGDRDGPGLEGAHRRGTDLLHPATGLRSQAKL